VVWGVFSLLSNGNHWVITPETNSQLENTNLLGSTGAGTLSEPGFEPKWDILSYRGGDIKPVEVDGRPGFVIAPQGKADKRRRWIWIAPSWLATGRWDTTLQRIVDSPEVDHLFCIQEVLAKGFHVAGIDIGVSCGNQAGVAVFQDFHKVLVKSNGGLMVYSYAATHPESVDRILGIYPATDLRSWPGLAKGHRKMDGASSL